jgi:hypothetical protein
LNYTPTNFGGRRFKRNYIWWYANKKVEYTAIDNFIGALRISPSQVIPTLQPLTFLRKNINVAGTPVKIFIKLGTYIISPQSVSKVH